MKNNKTQTFNEISSVYGHCVITDRQAQNCFFFSKFPTCDTLLKDGSRPRWSSDVDQNALKELEYNPQKSNRELTLDFSTSQSTGYYLCTIGKYGYLRNVHETFITYIHNVEHI